MNVPLLAVSVTMSFFSSLMVYSFMQRLLPSRLNNLGLAALSLIYTLWFNIRTPALYGTPFHLGMTVFINIWTPMIIIFLFKGKLWKRVIVYWYFDTIKAICEAIAFVPIMLYDASTGDRSDWSRIVSSIETSAVLKLGYMLVFLSLFLLFGYLSLKIWRRLLLKRFQPLYILFITLPLGQMYSLSLLIRPNMGNALFSILINITNDVESLYYYMSLIGIFICLVTDVVILCYILAQNKKTALEAELEATRHQMALEQNRYRELEQRQDDLAKIRHDFNNQLASVTRLALEGDVASAGELLSAIETAVNRSETV